MWQPSVRTLWEHVFVEKQVRTCKKHGPQVHYWNVVKRTGYGRWRCRRCSGEAVLNRKQRVRRLLILEAGDRCQACGYDRLRRNLHFHHVDPTQKEFELTSGNGKSLARFREEARKCVLVCANCHGEIEAGIRPSPPTMEQRASVFREPSLKLDDLAAWYRRPHRRGRWWCHSEWSGVTWR
jgi:hypothetical protein